MNQTRLEKGLYWERAWSLVEGCSPCSPGCDHCWAAAQAHMRQNQANPKIAAANSGLTAPNGKFNGQVRFRDDLLEAPLKVKKPTVWAVWTDLFHETIPGLAILEVFKIIQKCPQHTFLILTKRARRLRIEAEATLSFLLGFAWPLSNVWLGVTVCEQDEADKKIPLLLQIPAVKRFISVEPMLEPLDLSSAGLPDWVICGPETGPRARPRDPAWVQALARQCQAAGVPFFDKAKKPLRRELPWAIK